jgi:energy-coupling factor transporter ATP-binding protein EcfA2
MSRIEVRHVTHEYAAGNRRITALQDVSFTVGASESVCVLGQSGCGKTTLLNLLAGFFRPTRGKILVAGQAMAGKEAIGGSSSRTSPSSSPGGRRSATWSSGSTRQGAGNTLGPRGPPQHPPRLEIAGARAGAPPRSTRAITGSRSSTTVKRSANSAASAETTSQPPR